MKAKEISYTSNLDPNHIYELLDKNVLKLLDFGDVPNQDYSIKRKYCGTFNENKFSIQRGMMFMKMNNCTLNGEYTSAEEGGSLVKVEIKEPTFLLILKILAMILLPIFTVIVFNAIRKSEVMPVVGILIWYLFGYINYLVLRSRAVSSINELEKNLYSIIPKIDI